MLSDVGRLLSLLGKGLAVLDILVISVTADNK